MKSAINFLYCLAGIGIGLLIYHLFIAKKNPGAALSNVTTAIKSDSSRYPAFVMATRPFKEDTAYKKKYIMENPGMISNEDLFFSAPVDTGTVSNYVRNYKLIYPNNTYGFTLNGGEVRRLVELGGDIRVYFGLATPGDPSTGTVVLTGVNNEGGDIYLGNSSARTAIDQASPCPTNCPYLLRDAAMNANDVPATGTITTVPALNTSKSLLGRLWNHDQRHP